MTDPALAAVAPQTCCRAVFETVSHLAVSPTDSLESRSPPPWRPTPSPTGDPCHAQLRAYLCGAELLSRDFRGNDGWSKVADGGGLRGLTFCCGDF